MRRDHATVRIGDLERQGAELLEALQDFVAAFSLREDGSEDGTVEKWFRGPLLTARTTIAKAKTLYPRG